MCQGGMVGNHWQTPCSLVQEGLGSSPKGGLEESFIGKKLSAFGRVTPSSARSPPTASFVACTVASFVACCAVASFVACAVVAAGVFVCQRL